MHTDLGQREACAGQGLAVEQKRFRIRLLAAEKVVVDPPFGAAREPIHPAHTHMNSRYRGEGSNGDVLTAVKHCFAAQERVHLLLHIS